MIFFRSSKLNLNRSFALAADNVDFLYSAKQFHKELLSLISSAQDRIYITSLYLQDDVAGREVLNAIYEAKQNNPKLEVNLFVDFHRAQRGLIGAKKSLGNRQLYLDLSEKYEHDINIYGVAVKSREFLGVLHLKGFIVDDVVLFSGASINDVYLHVGDKYRSDRYHKFTSEGLADSFVGYLDTYFINNGNAQKLNQESVINKNQIKALTKKFKSILKNSYYDVPELETNDGDIFVTPFVGFGQRGNRLNLSARKVFRAANERLVVFTPYFNFPKALVSDLRKALTKGVEVTIIVGDKTANDFYITDEDKFSTIGIVPYIYEKLLGAFIKQHQDFIDNGQLNIHLWKDGVNSYHLKGVVADDKYHLITGSNLNPRAWSLDIENGLLIRDKNKTLNDKWQKELAGIMANTRRISSNKDIESVADYPEKPRELLRKIKITQIDRILKRFL